MKISAILLTHNNEKTLKKAIKSLSFCDEIILVDDFSNDRTQEIARKYNVKIFKKKLDSDFSSQRNFAISKAIFDYVFFLDSDEWVSPELAKSILNCDFKSDAYLIERQNIFFNKNLTHGEWGSQKIIRLVKKNSGKFVRKVHEYWQTKAKNEILKGIIYHEQRKTLSEFLSDLNIYSKLHAKELSDEHKNSNFYNILFKPVAKFISNFFIKFGYKDSTEGFIYAIFMSFHSFLSHSERWIKKN